MTLKQALLGATVLAVLPMAAQAQTTTTRRTTTAPATTTTTTTTTAAPVATMAPVAAPVAPYNPNIISGLYISGGIGGDMMLNSNQSGIQTQYKAGYVGVVAVGYGWGAYGGWLSGLRTEVEGNFRQNAIDKMKFASVTKGTGGYLNNYGAMANVLYDFDIGWPITPYLGAGVGIAQPQMTGSRATITQAQTATMPGAATGYYINDTSNWKFAYQAIVGGAYNLGNGLALTLEYRFFGTAMPNFGISRSSNNAAYPNVGSVPHYSNFQNLHNSLLLGVRYAFNQPAAPIPVAAPVAAAKTYLVFFDWNKYHLTDRARQIIGEAAAAARAGKVSRIEVIGHTDNTGTATYNQGLSVRRAEAVASELVRRGIPRNEIGISGVGATQPLVATGPNTREPQNRRAEIILR